MCWDLSSTGEQLAPRAQSSGSRSRGETCISTVARRSPSARKRDSRDDRLDLPRDAQTGDRNRDRFKSPGSAPTVAAGPGEQPPGGHVIASLRLSEAGL